MGVLHPNDRISALNRGNTTTLRQIESAVLAIPAWPPRCLSIRLSGMTEPDPTLAKIAAQFKHHDVEKARGGYMIVDRRTSNPVARLRPIPNTDRFELFYWSNVKARWSTFGNMGRMKLMLASAHEIIENDPMFRVPRA
jgi:hypothetical protein